MYLVKLYFNEKDAMMPFPIESFLLISDSKREEINKKVDSGEFDKLSIKFKIFGFECSAHYFVDNFLNFFKLNDKDADCIMKQFGVEFGTINLDAIFANLLNGENFIFEN